jgi:hypothetical protein
VFGDTVEMIFPYSEGMEKKDINTETLNTEFANEDGGSGGVFSLTTDPKVVQEYLEMEMTGSPNDTLFKDIEIEIDDPHAFNCVAPNGQKLVIFYGY